MNNRKLSFTRKYNNNHFIIASRAYFQPYPVAVDEAVVGAATTRWTTVPMKQDDAMKGSWSGAVDERRPSLSVDNGVGVAASARWRMGWRTEEAGRSGEVVVAPTVYEWGNGEGGGSQTLGRACLKCGKVTNLSPV